MYFTDRGIEELQARRGDEEVTFDRNHPLAGKGMKFSVTVREVREATPLEIEHGHPMSEDGGCGCGH